MRPPFQNSLDVIVSRSLCNSSLHYFSKLMLLKTRGVVWLDALHHAIVFDALERVFRGEITRLIINIPPRYSKTESLLMFVAWCLGQVPDCEFIFASYSGRLASTNSWRAREMVKSEAFRLLYPHVIIDDSSQAKDEWRTLAGGCVYATGTEGAITGYGAGKMRPGFGGAIIIDDPLKADDARSDVVRPQKNDWYLESLQSRANNKRTPIIVIAQRLHEEDMPGWLMNGGTGEHWDSIVLPAINEDGTALWPEKHTIEDLHRMQMAAPYMFAGQYLQRPSPPEGGIFKPDNIRIIDAAPRLVSKVRAWDLAASEDEGAYTAGFLLGVTENERYVILDVLRLQGSPDQVEEAIVSAAFMDGYMTKIGLPQDPGQAGKSQLAYYTKKLAGFTIDASPESGDKITRAGPFASQVNLGNVDMVRGEWNYALKHEMRHFPNSKYKDQVDASSRAFMVLSGRKPSMLITPELLQRASRPPVRVVGGM